MYTVFAVLLAAALIVLTVLGARAHSPAKGKRILFVNLWISAGSAVVGAVVPLLAHAVIFGSSEDAEWMEWAWDAFTLFVKTTLPLTGIALLLILLTTALTSVVGKKSKLFSAVIRQSASVAVSVILLCIAPFYSAMAETNGAPIHCFILLFGLCEALFMRLTFVLEMLLKQKGQK